jgi:hypothetical protein
MHVDVCVRERDRERENAALFCQLISQPSQMVNFTTFYISERASWSKRERVRGRVCKPSLIWSDMICGVSYHVAYLKWCVSLAQSMAVVFVSVDHLEGVWTTTTPNTFILHVLHYFKRIVIVSLWHTYDHKHISFSVISRVYKNLPVVQRAPEVQITYCFKRVCVDEEGQTPFKGT